MQQPTQCPPCKPAPHRTLTVRHVNQEGRVDGLGAEAQVAHGHAARLVRVVGEVGLPERDGWEGERWV